MDKWDVRFMEMTRLVSTWSSCYKTNRQVGAVVVRDKRILTTGYNGAPAGVESCKERGECLREKLGIASGTRQEMCYAVHAEQNAIIQAAKLGITLEGATLYCTLLLWHRYRQRGESDRQPPHSGRNRTYHRSGFAGLFKLRKCCPLNRNES